MINRHEKSKVARRQKKGDFRSYIYGAVISVALTIIAFLALMSDLGSGAKIWIICIAAVLQIATHLKFFLHLSFSGRQQREDLLLVFFSVILLTIMAGGTVWILTDLAGRMHQMNGMDMHINSK